MKYVLELTIGGKYEINTNEAIAISKADEEKSITINRLGLVFPKRIAVVYPEHLADQTEERRNQKFGFLHDGSRVVRYFGQWICDNGFVPDDTGKYQPVTIDAKYYPEVARDCVFTPQEWEQVKHLTTTERKEKILSLNGGKRITYDKKEFSSTNEILKEKTIL
jgi:hypothetical protein